MSKEEEELLIGIVVIWILLKFVSSSSSASALGLARIQSATDLGYVNAGATLASNLADDFSDD